MVVLATAIVVGSPSPGDYGYGGAPPPGDAAEGSGLAELEYSFDDWEVSTDDDNSP